MIRLHPCVLLLTAYYLSEIIPIIHALRVFQIEGEETILAFEKEDIIIQCKSDLPMNYCVLVHPGGKRFSLSDSTVNDGKCVHKIKARSSDSGEWKCHIGLKTERLETIKKIQVRIVNQLAAIRPNVTTKLRKPVTLACATTKGFVPINYCRFEPPNGRSFSIDASVNATNAILNKYYYPVNNSLDRGDCAVTIAHVKYEDAGEWTCGAGLEDGNEHIDIITVQIEGMHAMSTASATGVTFGGIIIAVVLVTLGYAAWKKRRILVGAPAEPEEVEVQELGPRDRPVTPQQRRDRPVTPQQRTIPRVTVESPSESGEPSSSPLLPRS